MIVTSKSKDLIFENENARTIYQKTMRLKPGLKFNLIGDELSEAQAIKLYERVRKENINFCMADNAIYIPMFSSPKWI